MLNVLRNFDVSERTTWRLSLSDSLSGTCKVTVSVPMTMLTQEETGSMEAGHVGAGVDPPARPEGRNGEGVPTPCPPPSIPSPPTLTGRRGASDAGLPGSRSRQPTGAAAPWPGT